MPQAQRTHLTGLMLVAAALIASAAAQFLFRANVYSGGLGGTLVAVGLTWLYARRHGSAVLAEPASSPSPDLASSRAFPWHPALATLALCALALTLTLQRWDLYDPLQLVSWAVAVIFLNAAYVQPGHWARCRGFRLRAEHALIFALITGGMVLRLYHLGTIPGGFYGDEGEFGLRALALLDGVRVRPFEAGWDAHPTLFTHLQAGAMALTARDVAGVRLVPAVAGGLTLLPWYLFLRHAAGFWTALAGTVLLAVCPWHIHFSRIASNDAVVTLWTVVAMGALYRATRSGAAQAYVLAGTSLGLCFYFGNKAVMLPPMMIAGLAALIVVERSDIPSQWRMWLVGLAVALCVFAPQLCYYATHDWYRALLYHPLSKLVSMQPQAGKAAAADGQTWFALAVYQVERSILAFHYYPDQGIFQSSGRFPLLPAGLATFYLVGLAYCLARRRTPLAAFLLAWFVVGLLGSILSGDPPQGHHLIGMIAVPAAFAALGIDLARRQVAAGLGRRLRAGVPVATVLLLGGLATQAAREYFVGYAASWPIQEITGIARAMRDLGPTHHLVLVTLPMMWDQNGTLRFIAYGIKAEDKLTTLDPKAPWFKPTDRDVAFIVDGRRPDFLNALRARYPHGILREQYSSNRRLVVATYQVSQELLSQARSAP